MNGRCGPSRGQSSNPSLAWQLGACAQSSPSPAARHSISIRSFGRPTPSPVQEQRVTRRQEDRPASMRRAGPEIITPSEQGADFDQEIGQKSAVEGKSDSVRGNLGVDGERKKKKK